MAPMSCYSTCDPCMTGCAPACPTKYVSPYSGQYYYGGECGSACGGCSSGCGGCVEGYRPFARLCSLLSLGDNSCGCACEKYYGDYINNPPSLCNPCDQFGGLAGFSAKCSSGTCDTCYDSYSPMMSSPSMSYAPISQPMVQPAMMSAPAAGCKTCNQGNTFYTSSQVRPQPQPQVPVMPVQQNVMIARNPMPQIPMQQQPVIIAQNRPTRATQTSQQPVLQDKLVTAGSQQVNYRMTPVRQVTFSTTRNDQFGTASKVIQPATIPTNGRVVHAN